MNGFGRGMLCPSSVTLYACMTSSSALWVFAGARLISSASRTWVNTGPRTILNSWEVGSSTACPMMSEGIMSGVNCTRPCVSDSACASALTSNVLPRPGTPSMSTCPEAASDITTCSITADCPTTAWLIAVCRRSSSSAARWIVLDSISMSGPCVLDQNSTPRRFEQLEGRAQMLRAARAGVVQGGCKRVSFEAGGVRQGAHSLGTREPLIGRDVQCRHLVQSAGSRGVQRFSAPDAQRKLTGAANLLGKRSPRDVSRSRQWTESRAAAPECECDQHQQQTDRRPAELPGQLEQRCMAVLGEEMDLIAATQL